MILQFSKMLYAQFHIHDNVDMLPFHIALKENFIYELVRKKKFRKQWNRAQYLRYLNKSSETNHLFGNKENLLYFLMKFDKLPHLEFKVKEIEDYDNFIKNQKYIQIYQKYEYTIVDIVIYREEQNYDNTFCLSFSLYKQIERYEMNRYNTNGYYEFVSKKKEIQEAMEERSLQFILQNIIGDKMFQW